MCSSWIGMSSPNLNLGGTLMGNNNYKYKRFDSFLNKTIVLCSKRYYKEELTRNLTELKIMDDENYNEYMKDYVKIDDDVYNSVDVDNFIDLCDNPVLIRALKSLSNIEMTVIFLLFEKQLTSSEASKILKICSDSVTRINRRALRKIEKYLKGDE